MDIRTLCLGILTWGDASGYEIKKIFEDRLSYFYEASYGSIYPALTKLTDDGLVSCRAEAQDKRPDKKVYAITPTGRMAFMDATAGRAGPAETGESKVSTPAEEPADGSQSEPDIESTEDGPPAGDSGEARKSSQPEDES